MSRKSKRKAARRAALANAFSSEKPLTFPLTAVDLAINARAQVVLWEVCRVVGATGRDGEPNDNALCVWGFKSEAEVETLDLMAWGCCVGTGLRFTGYYAAMNASSLMARQIARQNPRRRPQDFSPWQPTSV